jgi:aspartyl-tRNA(Asn)/glutamyl-tRNA(Gln) amidotransferase subunit A
VAAVSNPADLTVVETSTLLHDRQLSAVELAESCLRRIGERDGTHSFDGDPGSINAWIRVYEEDALAAAARADERLARGDAPRLCGVPIGLKDLYGVAGKPVTASSRVLDEVPDRDCDVWARLAAEGMVLLGHLHTHEFAAGGTTDQVGNPWDLSRTAGGSSGGSAAALAARMVPAATGTDTAGSLRIPSHCCGTSTIKPTRGLVSIAGIVPLSYTLDHAGPMARALADCALLLAAMLGSGEPSDATLSGARIAVSPRIGELDPDVADAFDGALELCRRRGATLVDAPRDVAPLDIDEDYFTLFDGDVLAYHRRFDDRRELYRPSIRQIVEGAEQRALSAEEYVRLQWKRLEAADAWERWLTAERVDAIVEPTLPIVAFERGAGYTTPGHAVRMLELTYYWNWTGFPAVAFPAGRGSRSGLPVGVSLTGSRGTDWRLLALGIELQAELGIPAPPGSQP